MTDFTPLPALVGGVLVGLAATLLMLTAGRIAGISGFISRLLPPYSAGGADVRLGFLAGLVLGPLALAQVTGTAIPAPALDSPVLLGIAGVLVGFGTVLSNGCTSGHGVCGLALLSRRALAATATFMTAGVLTVFVMRHVVGA